MRNIMTCFSVERGGQRDLLASAVCHVSSAQDNQDAKAAYFGVMCSETSQ